MTSPKALHSATTAEHYTPPEIVEAARHVLGRIDVDPFSCAAANAYVKAASYADGTNADGFEDNWAEPDDLATAFVNPPGGKYARDKESGLWRAIEKGPGVSGAARAWQALLKQHAEKRVRSAIFVCFSMNVFQNAQRLTPTQPPFMFPFCVPAKRLRYLRADGVLGKSPPHPSAIVFAPSLDKDQAREEVQRFVSAFGPLGAVRL